MGGDDDTGDGQLRGESRADDSLPTDGRPVGCDGNSEEPSSAKHHIHRDHDHSQQIDCALEFPRGGLRWTTPGGDVIEDLCQLSDSEIHEIAFEVDRLVATWDGRSRTVMAHVGVEPKLGDNDHLLGWYEPNTNWNGRLHLNLQWIRNLDRQADNKERATSHFMPSSRCVSTLKYVLAHEFGHSAMALMQNDNIRFRDEDSPIAQISEIMRYGREHPDFGSPPGLSTYGLGSDSEAFAEAFAEWHVTAGRTLNAAARAYAEVLQWPSSETMSSLRTSRALLIGAQRLF